MSDALQQTNGVKELAVDARGMVVAYDAKRTAPDRLVEAVERAGYHAKVR